MKVADFDYRLPAELIAQTPSEPRGAARLMRLERGTDRIEHRRFADLPDLLRAGDLLVLNDTRVVPARLVGRKPSGGRVELLLLEREPGPDDAPVWWCWLRASRAPTVGSAIRFDDSLRAEILAREGNRWRVRLHAEGGDAPAVLERVGRMPLPPYVRRREGDPRHALDRERYQTVFARQPGAVAAPTAGLHFDEEMLATLERRGVGIAFLTLHVGPGTFEPVRVDDVERHVMHEELFELPERTAAAVSAARERRGRVVAVGTTTVRTLEHRGRDDGLVSAGSGRCGLFLYPGYRFRVVDVLLTNFHLPRSTLLMLVAAFAGRERVLAAYREAVRERYRFYSYGDAMWVERA